jgi:hypothetical protein
MPTSRAELDRELQALTPKALLTDTGMERWNLLYPGLVKARRSIKEPHYPWLDKKNAMLQAYTSSACPVKNMAFYLTVHDAFKELSVHDVLYPRDPHMTLDDFATATMNARRMFTALQKAVHTYCTEWDAWTYTVKMKVLPESDAMPGSKVTPAFTTFVHGLLTNASNIGDCPVDDYVKLYARLFQFHKALGKPATGGGQMNANAVAFQAGLAVCTLVLGALA